MYLHQPWEVSLERVCLNRTEEFVPLSSCISWYCFFSRVVGTQQKGRHQCKQLKSQLSSAWVLLYHPDGTWGPKKRKAQSPTVLRSILSTVIHTRYCFYLVLWSAVIITLFFHPSPFIHLIESDEQWASEVDNKLFGCFSLERDRNCLLTLGVWCHRCSSSGDLSE